MLLGGWWIRSWRDLVNKEYFCRCPDISADGSAHAHTLNLNMMTKGPKGPNRAQKDPKGPKMAINWPKMAEKGPKGPNMAKDGRQWQKMSKIGQHWPTIANHGPTTPDHVFFFCQFWSFLCLPSVSLGFPRFPSVWVFPLCGFPRFGFGRFFPFLCEKRKTNRKSH